MRSSRAIMAVVSSLALIGAGCGAGGDAATRIEAAADGIDGDQAAEQSELKLEERDAAYFDADRAEVDSYGNAAYEIK